MSTALRRLLVVAAASLCGLVPAAAQSDGVDARMAFRIHDDRVTESSGLAISRTHPGLAYTVNDSGDDARVLVLSMRDGSVVGETRLRGVQAVDVEALAPASRGRLVVADIGDNGADRESAELYVLDEPGRGQAEVDPRRVSLSYPGGARDAEALVVEDGRVFVVTKEVLGGTVFAAPVLRSSHDAYGLRRVASAPPVVTDAALLADGEVVMRDYARAYVADLPRWRVRTSYPLPRVEQGETVAAAPDSRRVYVGSEGESSPVYVVPVPDTTQTARTGTQQQPAVQNQNDAKRAGDDQTGDNQTDESEDDEQDRPRARPPGYIVAVAAAIVIGFLLRRYRRRRHHRNIR